jgi:dolichol kinase
MTMELETAMERPRASITGGRELGRKLIHLAGSVAAALIILLAPTGPARASLLAAATLALTIELVRRISPYWNRRFNRIFGVMLRNRERGGITGATTLPLGFVAAALLTPPTLAGAGILMAGIGDAAGALIGRYFGRHRIPGGKSMEGSAACFAAAGLVALLVPGITIPIAIAGALVTTLIEAAIGSFDDNLILPLAAALTLQIGSAGL